jgi:hypothetical protein
MSLNIESCDLALRRGFYDLKREQSMEPLLLVT